MTKNIKEEELSNITGAGELTGKRLPKRKEEDTVCPFCGRTNHAVFKAISQYSPFQEYDTCGFCTGYREGNCDGVIIFQFDDCNFYYKHSSEL